MASYDDSYGGYHRVMEIDPYRPARTELIGDNTGEASSKDVGKPVKLDGEGVDLCASGDEIYGIIESVNAGTHGGHSVGGVLSASGNQAYATDEGENLAVGDLVKAGTAAAYGTAVASSGPNVLKVSGSEDPALPGIHRWIVVAVYSADRVLIRKL